MDAVHALARSSDTGLTTLPKDRARLAEGIRLSERALSTSLEAPGADYHLFVLEDQGVVIGTSAITGAVGIRQPFYTYTIGKIAQASPSLGVNNIVDVLYLGSDFTGCSEIGTLYLAPEHRGGGRGTLLSRSRFLFLAEFPERFADTVIAEMRGVADAQGRSPFWEALGQKFFSMPFPEADALCAFGNQFIGELMPKYPIYVCLLPEEARVAIGRVHPDSRRASELLRAEGFRLTGRVDIFDAGPLMEATASEIQTVRESRRLEAVVTDGTPGEAAPAIVSNTRLAGWRACLASVGLAGDGCARLAPETGKALEIESGENVRVVSLRSSRTGG